MGAESVSIVIVNWNSANLLTEAVESVHQHAGDLVAKIVIVDNASTDTSIAQLRERTPAGENLVIVRNRENRGFAAACNQGAALCRSKYILFLNPDTRLMPDALQNSLNYIEAAQNAAVGILGVQMIDESGSVARSCARFPSLKTFVAQVLGLPRLARFRRLSTHMLDWDHATTRTVDHVIGAYFFMRLSLFRSLGGFDERFFVYLEDLDFSLRARQAGWSTTYLSTARIFHAGGGSSRQVKAQRLFYSIRSRILYAFKHMPRGRAWTVASLSLFVEPFTRLMLASAHRSAADAFNTLRAYWRLWKDLPTVLRVAHRATALPSRPDGANRTL
ncbi:MAG: glycosyltransferase family 2 protein [Proteobacteria bacterium]|nr:glycosyltransferase family 2 protein [Pseudomonadota bacterium]